ncbi:MAG: hypothetical protein ACE5QF_06130 [Thermoplasmata archaeon]
MASLEPERPYDHAEGFIDPAYESLKLRAEAAETVVRATKHHLRCMSLRQKIATLELKKARLEEEKARLVERSRFFIAQAKQQKRELSNSETRADHAVQELSRKQDKAAYLRRKCAGYETRIDRLEEKIRDLQEQAEREEKLKDEQMEQSKRLEIQAMNYEKS